MPLIELVVKISLAVNNSSGVIRRELSLMLMTLAKLNTNPRVIPGKIPASRGGVTNS